MNVGKFSDLEFGSMLNEHGRLQIFISVEYNQIIVHTPTYNKRWSLGMMPMERKLTIETFTAILKETLGLPDNV